MAGFAYFSSVREAPSSFATAVLRSLAPSGYDGLTGERRIGEGGLFWHQGAHAPFDSFEGTEGSAFLWGDAVGEADEGFFNR